MTGELSVLDKTGDTKIIWDSARRDEVDAARRAFDDLKAKGYLAYSVTKKGDKDEVIKKFDPDAERIIMAPPLVGG
jgi:hypothetical protein